MRRGSSPTSHTGDHHLYQGHRVTNGAPGLGSAVARWPFKDTHTHTHTHTGGWAHRGGEPAEPPTFPRPFPPGFRGGAPGEESPSPPRLLHLLHRLLRADGRPGSAGEEGAAWGASRSRAHARVRCLGITCSPDPRPSSASPTSSRYSRGVQVALLVEGGARRPPSQPRQSYWPSGNRES